MRFIPRLAPTVFMASALLTACGNDADPITEPTTPNNNQGIAAGTLEASATRPNIRLRNTTEQVVGYMIVDKDMATIALFPPCDARCPQLVQGASIDVPYSSIAGYSASSTEAIVMWWTYSRRADGTMQPEGGVNTTRVRLD